MDWKSFACGVIAAYTIPWIVMLACLLVASYQRARRSQDMMREPWRLDRLERLRAAGL